MLPSSEVLALQGLLEFGFTPHRLQSARERVVEDLPVVRCGGPQHDGVFEIPLPLRRLADFEDFHGPPAAYARQTNAGMRFLRVGGQRISGKTHGVNEDGGIFLDEFDDGTQVRVPGQVLEVGVE